MRDFRIVSFALVAFTFLVCIRVVVLAGQPAAFSVLGEKFQLDSEVIKIPVMDSGGYDGQFFTRIALDPLNFEKEALGVAFDIPEYRFQRILYPLFVSFLSFGNQQAVPVIMILVNVLALVVMVFFLLKISHHYNFDSRYALLLSIAPGLLMGLARNLAEPLTACLLVASFYSLISNRFLVYGILASLCVLSRETSLVVFAALGFVHLFSIGRLRFKILYFVAPAIVFSLWQYTLFRVYGNIPLTSGPNNFGLPFIGVLTYLTSVPKMDLKEVIVQSIYSFYFLFLLLFFLKGVIAKTSDLVLKSLQFSVIIWSIMAVFFSHLIWEDDWSFNRVLGDWALCGLLMILMQHKRLPRGVIAASVLISTATIARIIIKV